jgi:hypothetical protein
MLKKIVVANFKALPRYLPGITEQETTNLSHDADFPAEILKI